MLFFPQFQEFTLKVLVHLPPLIALITLIKSTKQQHHNAGTEQASSVASEHAMVEHPLLIRDEPEDLTPEQLEDARERFRALRTNYLQEDALVANVSRENQLIIYQHLVRDAFALAGVNSNDYPGCFAACVDKCLETRVLDTRAWSSWGGYREFAELANAAAKYTQETHKIHLPYAPFLVAAMAVRMLRKFEPRPEDQLTPLVINFQMFEHLQGVIKSWTPTTPVIMHTTLDYKNAKGQAKFDDPQRLAQTAGVVILIEEDDAITNKAGLTVECQEFVQPFVKPRPRDTVMVAVHIKRRLTRDEVAFEVDPTMDQLIAEYEKVQADELLDELTEHMVAVMPASRKLLLGAWAEVEGKKAVVDWVKKAKEDKTEVEWTESKLVPEEWSDMVQPHEHLETLLDITKDMDDAVRQRIASLVFGIRHYFITMRKRHMDKAEKEAMREMGGLSQGLLDKIKREIDQVFQEAIGEPSLTWIQGLYAQT
ncbi:uncharacterized protein TRIREDRAFT_112281 [Trichoderma reesei QM6a]|uniref:Predicted protein n=1 Tax=Hypocrea jecorina (strain QM6a) TaxID=431241 RepID=G0RWN4_HYPJQ|nr:uncharacterized protein TRIREDRAFT_112281 [Trichoderma reesei QM6a]EGR44382.1 predicted protein [Trichoderma reesei QM6a]